MEEKVRGCTVNKVITLINVGKLYDAFTHLNY